MAAAPRVLLLGCCLLLACLLAPALAKDKDVKELQIGVKVLGRQKQQQQACSP